jgi:hypothetical protein
MESALAYQPVAENGGSLIKHTIKIDDPNPVRTYISRMPEYKGNNIPNTLNREKTVRPYENDYFLFFNFFEKLAEFGTSNRWIVAGLLSETGIMGVMPVVGSIVASKKYEKSGVIQKQILCRKISETQVVAIINIVNSAKPELNDMYVKKIMVVNTRDMSVLVYSLDNGQITPQPKTDVGVIEKTLSATPVYVVDPNIVENVSKTKVEWFEDKSMYDIDTVIKKNISLVGGKRRTRNNNNATRRKIKTRVSRQKRRRRTSRK